MMRCLRDDGDRYVYTSDNDGFSLICTCIYTIYKRALCKLRLTALSEERGTCHAGRKLDVQPSTCFV